MPKTIGTEIFFTAAEVTHEIGVSRQTLWRWRQRGVVPGGSRYRNRQVLFTEDDLARIKEYADRIEPADEKEADQPGLFDTGRDR